MGKFGRAWFPLASLAGVITVAILVWVAGAADEPNSLRAHFELIEVGMGVDEVKANLGHLPNRKLRHGAGILDVVAQRGTISSEIFADGSYEIKESGGLVTYSNAKSHVTVAKLMTFATDNAEIQVIFAPNDRVVGTQLAGIKPTSGYIHRLAANFVHRFFY